MHEISATVDSDGLLEMQYTGLVCNMQLKAGNLHHLLILFVGILTIQETKCQGL